MKQAIEVSNGTWAHGDETTKIIAEVYDGHLQVTKRQVLAARRRLGLKNGHSLCLANGSRDLPSVTVFDGQGAAYGVISR